MSASKSKSHLAGWMIRLGSLVAIVGGLASLVASGMRRRAQDTIDLGIGIPGHNANTSPDLAFAIVVSATASCVLVAGVVSAVLGLCVVASRR